MKELQQCCYNRDWMEGGGLILWNAIFYLRIVQDFLADVRTPYERRFGEPFKGPIILFGAMVEYHPISVRDQSRLHHFGKKVFPQIFLRYELIAGGIWKGDILTAELETLHASKMEMNSFSQWQMVQQNFQGETTISENPSEAGTNRKE